MNADACRLCQADPWEYRSGCAACRVRLAVRMRDVDYVVQLLRELELEHGRELAERVKRQAVEQRKRFGPR